jgi:hypothetical protein
MPITTASDEPSRRSARTSVTRASLGLLALVLAGCAGGFGEAGRGDLYLDSVELQPLLRSHTATAPKDINDLGTVVGSSGDCGSSCQRGVPSSVATLWTAGVPSAISMSVNSSEALRINNDGSVLYVQSDNPESLYAQSGHYSNPTYFLWKNGSTVDLSTRVPGLVSARDLNNSGLILGTRIATNPFFLYDSVANTIRSLPNLVVPNAVTSPTVHGVDSAGRVIAATHTNKATPMDVYYLPAGGASWIYTGISLPNTVAGPKISKSGLVLASVLDGYANNVGCYIDLNNPDAGVSYLPLYKPDPRRTNWHWNQPEDAARGWIVTYQFDGGSSFLYDAALPYIYKINGTQQGWDLDQVRTINVHEQMAGLGYKNGQLRGWVSKPSSNVVRMDPVLYLMILFGVREDGGGVGTGPGGPPIPIGPWGVRLSQQG